MIAYPEHLSKNAFIKLVLDLTTQRLDNKRVTGELKKKLKTLGLNEEEQIAYHKANTATEALKIVINSIYGKLGDQDSFLYDLKAMYTVTINGQLYLLMLCEDLELNGIHIISANTDGIVAKVNVNQIELYNKICDDWSKKTNFTLEFVTYEKITRIAVNSYLAVKEGFNKAYNKLLEEYKSYWLIPDKELKELESNYVKEKGEFITDVVFNKGYYAPVIAKCLKARYIYGININEFFDKSIDIYDYCISQKIASTFNLYYISSPSGIIKEEQLQKNTRFYVIHGGGSIIKRYKDPKPNKKGVIVKEISLLSKCAVKEFNNYYSCDNFKDYNVDMRFYKKEMMDYIINIEQNQNTLF